MPFGKIAFCKVRVSYSMHLHAKCYYSDTYIVLKLRARYLDLRGDKHVGRNCRTL
jgi:hypothetical protein